MNTKPPLSSTWFTSREYCLIHGVVMRFIRNEQEAEDVAQDVMIFVAAHMDACRETDLLTTWLYRVAKTVSLEHLRRCGHDHIDFPEEPSPQELSQYIEFADFLQSSLSPTNYQLFVLRFVEEYSNLEAAKILGLPLSKVKTRVGLIRDLIRGEFVHSSKIR